MNLNTRTLRRSLWSVATLLTAAAILIAVMGLGRGGNSLFNLGVRTSNPSTLNTVTALGGGGNTVTDESGTLAAFAGLLDRPLRAPLFDPPPVVQPVAPPPPPPPPLRLRLLGTVVEGDNSLAIVMPASGKVEMVPLGTIIDNTQITSITDQNITVLYHGIEQTLAIQP